MKIHKTRKIAIKEADVDIEIIPLVNYLNSFHGITTLWSCQGDEPVKGKTYDLPYVVFIAEDLASIKNLLEHLDHHSVEVIIESFNEIIALRFHMRFASKDCLKKMLKWVKEHDH